MNNLKDDLPPEYPTLTTYSPYSSHISLNHNKWLWPKLCNFAVTEFYVEQEKSSYLQDEPIVLLCPRYPDEQLMSWLYGPMPQENQILAAIMIWSSSCAMFYVQYQIYDVLPKLVPSSIRTLKTNHIIQHRVEYIF